MIDGNVMQQRGELIYDYTESQGNPYLTTIRYGDLTTPYEVRFEPYYSSTIQTFDVLPQLDKGFAVIPHRDLLDRVTVIAPGTDDKLHYELTYTTDGTFNLLTNIQKQGENNAGLISDPPVTFAYDRYNGERSIPLTLPDDEDRKVFQDVTRIGRTSHAIYGDYNHDSWMDIVMNYDFDYYSSDNLNYDARTLFLNNKDGTWTRDDNALVDQWDNYRYPPLFSYSNSGYYLNTLKVADLNGDFDGNEYGTDIVSASNTPDRDGWHFRSPTSDRNYSVAKDEAGYFAEIKGDSLIDYLRQPDDQPYAHINTGTGWPMQSVIIPNDIVAPGDTVAYFSGSSSVPNTAGRVLDINNDGLVG